MIDYKILANAACEARKYSYSPFSHFSVGAAVLTANGKIYSGCNIENSSYSDTICAERVAMSKAVSEGEREFAAIAVAGDGEYIVPCGICLQFICEFCGRDFPVVRVKSPDDYKISYLKDLLPEGFKL